MVGGNFQKAISMIKDKCEPKEIVSELSDAVNNLTFNTCVAAEYIYSCGSDYSVPFSQIAFAWINTLAKQKAEHHYDSRNERSVSVGAELATFLCVVSHPSCAYYSDWALSIAEYMSKEHRTLQQTFSGLVFKFLQIVFRIYDEFETELEAAGLDKECWWSMPLI